MYLVNDYVIKPITEEGRGGMCNLSWSLMCNPTGIELDLFVSHAWIEGVFEFEQNLLESWPEDKHAAWICFLANPQNGDINSILGNSPDQSPFADALYCLSDKARVRNADIQRDFEESDPFCRLQNRMAPNRSLNLLKQTKLKQHMDKAGISPDMLLRANQTEPIHQRLWCCYELWLASTLDLSITIAGCLLYTSPSPRDRTRSRMPSSA
eukprot:TRINITY_DN13426_c0_g2_i1.p1 TRINITY_DN13426_c0_g2~~TRINITY_DN13426_c0_g2_i1.p1  ORF type:complete len:210 (+),score=48.14 TRINITY_DN13426_c0_g2_i1:283-912(+)